MVESPEIDQAWLTPTWFIDSDAPDLAEFVSRHTDGLDPDSCEDVLIEHCDLGVGDDAIAIKSGMGAAGRAFGGRVARDDVGHRDGTEGIDRLAEDSAKVGVGPDHDRNRRRKALEIDPDYDGAWAHLGRLLYERFDRYEEAAEALRKAVEPVAESVFGANEIAREHVDDARRPLALSIRASAATDAKDLLERLSS